MKKQNLVWLFSLVALLTFSFAFTSCSDDDDDFSASSSDVVGSWLLTSEKEDGEEFKGTEDWEDDLFVFASDGTLKEYYGTSTSARCYATGTWTLSGNTLTLTMSEDGDEYAYTATLTSSTTFYIKEEVDAPDGKYVHEAVYTKQ